MNPRKPLSYWQFFAQGPALAKMGFAWRGVVSHDGAIDDLSGLGLGLGQNPAVSAPCDPFQKTWPVPFGGGSFFYAAFRAVAGLAGAGRSLAHEAGTGGLGHDFAFVSEVGGVESAPITKTLRGTRSCGNSSPFFLLPRPWLAACKTPVRAGWRVPSLARPLPTTKTPRSSMVRSSADLPVLRLARFPARWVARKLSTSDLTAKAAGQTTKPATHGDAPRGWLFHFRPARAALT